MHNHQNQSDGFDRIPDSLILLIFDSVSDIKTLIRCRTVSKRFNSLVPQTESLLLQVDRVISTGSEQDDDDSDSFIVTFLKSIVKTVHDIVSPHPIVNRPAQNSPSQILGGFDRIRNLQIELPAGDLRLEKGALIRWSAAFGKSLKTCVILGIRSIHYSPESTAAVSNGGGLKMRVVWTISALIAASARHYMLKEVIRDHNEIANLIVTDKDGEGTVVMDKLGLHECREAENEEAQVSETVVHDKSRTTVPAVRMRMRHEPWLELKSGVRVQGATLVVVRPVSSASEVEEFKEDSGLALGAFDGVYGEAVQSLLKSRSYLLEMNSF